LSWQKSLSKDLETWKYNMTSFLRWEFKLIQLLIPVLLAPEEVQGLKIVWKV
jgi:hypothetical protein